MIRYVLGTDLWHYPELAQTMFRDRAIQFSERLAWKVDVDRKGYESDQYDALNPIYVIIEDVSGRHAGSMRLLPTTGRTVINEHFLTALEDAPITSSTTWECTRFCLSPSAAPRTAAKLFAAAGRLMQELNVTLLVGVFDHLMLRKYRISGVAPEVLCEVDVAGTFVLIGQWQFCQAQLKDLMRGASLDPLEYELALVNSSLERGRISAGNPCSRPT
tara:strand:+ start:1049 stop:1699 length:651 start_codon:yes stop_codon:yes gene_type:complete